jgi:hypothetical protein
MDLCQEKTSFLKVAPYIICQLIYCPLRIRYEAWRGVSQVLKDIVAQNADATVSRKRPTCISNDVDQPTSRNLVTSLFEHEQIKTTLPKARDAARLAEKVDGRWIPVSNYRAS